MLIDFFFYDCAISFKQYDWLESTAYMVFVCFYRAFLNLLHLENVVFILSDQFIVIKVNFTCLKKTG